MQFDLTDTDRQIIEAARSYAEEVVAPRAQELDRKEDFELELWQEARKRKLVGIAIPAEYGGNGLGNLQLSMVLEEINRVCASTGITLSVHNSLLASPIIHFGSDDQKQRFLPKLASGEWLGCYSLTEPQSGSDAAGLTCKAVKQGECYIINGVKSWVTSGAFADVVLLMARTGEHKTRGITSFVVRMDTPGVSISKSEEKSGLRGSKTNELTFTDVQVPADCVLGEEGIGFKIALNTLDGGRVGVAAQSVGIARGCLEAAAEVLRREKEIGRGPQWETRCNLLADMSCRVDASRLMVWRAASLRDAKQPCTAEAASAKLFASRTANECARLAMQIVGETAYATSPSVVERYLRDARITEIYEGTTEIQKLVIARNLLSL